MKNRSRIYTSHHFHLNAQSSHLIAFLEEGNVSVCSLRSHICLVKKLFSNKDFYHKIWYEYYHHKITNNFITNLRHSKDVNVWRNELQYYFSSKLFFFQILIQLIVVIKKSRFINQFWIWTENNHYITRK